MPEGGWELEESRTTWPRLARSKRPVCLQESPTSPGGECRAPPEDSRPASQTVAAQVRVPGEPSSFFLPQSRVACAPGTGEARGGSVAGFWVLPRSAHRGVERATAARRQMRVRPRRRQRRAHPQTVQSCGGPAELTVTGWCLLRSAGASRSSPRSGVSLCGRRWV